MTDSNWDAQLKFHLQQREQFYQESEKVGVYVLDDSIGRRILDFISSYDVEESLFEVKIIQSQKDLIDNLKCGALPAEIKGFPCVQKESEGPLFYSMDAIREIRQTVDNDICSDQDFQRKLETAIQNGNEEDVLDLFFTKRK